jgi:hypothetical protein
MRRFVGAAVLGLGLVSVGADAGVIVQSHNRSVEASISNPPAGQTITAPDANPFSQTAVAQVNFNAETSTMTAAQNSSFGVAGGDTLTANVFTRAVSDTRTLPNPITLADSTFEITFTLDAPGTWSLTGAGIVSSPVYPDPGFYTSFLVNLTGPNGIEYIFSDESLMPGIDSKVFNEGGALVPGQYTFSARAVGGGTANVRETAELEIQFQVVSPGGPGNPGGGPGANVPLPAGVWAGMALGAWVMRRKLPRRAAR